MVKDKNNTNKKTLLQKLRYKYRLIILNEDTFEQKTSLRLSRMNLYVFGSVFFIVVVAMVLGVIAFSPLKYYMPGVGSIDVRTRLIEMEMMTNSLENQVDKRNLWLESFQKALSGDLDSTFFLSDHLSTLDYENVDIDAVEKNELEFREEMKDKLVNIEEKTVALGIYKNSSADAYPLNYTAPTTGVVIGFFSEQDKQYGIDIAGMEKENVRAVESGVIFSADWNPKTGYVIGVQHKRNTVSFYKHNNVILKKVGSFVRRGEIIALMGNSGHPADRPHLHFELWQNGKAVNPLDYMDINTIN